MCWHTGTVEQHESEGAGSRRWDVERSGCTHTAPAVSPPSIVPCPAPSVSLPDLALCFPLFRSPVTKLLPCDHSGYCWLRIAFPAVESLSSISATGHQRIVGHLSPITGHSGFNPAPGSAHHGTLATKIHDLSAAQFAFSVSVTAAPSDSALESFKSDTIHYSSSISPSPTHTAGLLQ